MANNNTNSTTQYGINREYKDRLFKLIFKEKSDLLTLYNALNGTNYNNPEDIEINTLEDAVFMGMKNDISFLFTDVLNLYEHQSTFNPNLPLRALFYFTDLIKKQVGRNKDLYSSRLIPLPFPQFIVFYNGTTDEPDIQTIHLSDAFDKRFNNMEPSLQCTATIININLGYNKELLDKCKKLEEYAIFVATVRMHIYKGLSIQESIEKAVDQCIKDHVLEDILTDNRMEVCSMLLTEYNEELHIKSEINIALEDLAAQYEQKLAEYKKKTAQYEELSAKCNDISAKCNDIASKYEDMTSKYEDVSSKYEDVSSKYEDEKHRAEIAEAELAKLKEQIKNMK